MRMNKKGLLSNPIIWLVLLEVCLILFTLFYFNSKHQQVERTIVLSNEVDGVYIQEAQLNFILQNILDSASLRVDSSYSKESFINEFKKELNRYKNLDGSYFIKGLNQVEDQLNSGNVDINDKKVSLVLKFIIDNSGSNNNLKVTYSYVKKFEKYFNSSPSPSNKQPIFN